MTYNLKAWKRHNGRNPAHKPGGYARAIYGALGMVLGYRPRNPSRWLPHVGGASCGPRPAQPAVSVVTRQQHRRAQILAAKRVASEANEATRKRRSDGERGFILTTWRAIRATWRAAVSGRLGAAAISTSW